MRHVAVGFALSCAASALVFCASPSLAQQQQVGSPPEALNMRLVGSNDLQGRSAYQPTIAHQGDRYIAYIGHHGGTPGAQTNESLERSGGVQRHVDRRRD